MIVTAEQTSSLLCARGFFLWWILLGNPGPARLILHHLVLFPPEPIGSALEFDTLRSWDLFGKSFLDTNVLQPIVQPDLPPW